MKPNELVEILTNENERAEVEQEWDADAICKQIVGQNPGIVKSQRLNQRAHQKTM